MIFIVLNFSSFQNKIIPLEVPIKIKSANQATISQCNELALTQLNVFLIYSISFEELNHG